MNGEKRAREGGRKEGKEGWLGGWMDGLMDDWIGNILSCFYFALTDLYYSSYMHATAYRRELLRRYINTNWILVLKWKDQH